MADAHGSGPCVRKDVRVQLPPRPPLLGLREPPTADRWRQIRHRAGTRNHSRDPRSTGSSVAEALEQLPAASPRSDDDVTDGSEDTARDARGSAAIRTPTPDPSTRHLLP